MGLNRPERLTHNHIVTDFDCGDHQLNDWLKRKAIRNEGGGASRTYVVCWHDSVIAYYCLSSGAVFHNILPGKYKRNMPDPVPVIVIGRLAVDRNWQGKGIGGGLLKDACLRSLEVSEVIGVKAILVHAISSNAVEFYTQYGFTPSPVQPLTLLLLLKDIEFSY
jgi:GNAT superfamily N-acetyltransferase